MNALLRLVLVTAAALVTAACSASADGPGGSSELPPIEILADGLARAELAVELEVTAVERVADFSDDAGRPGYVQHDVTGRVTRVLEGDATLGATLTYRCTLEADSGRIPGPAQPGRRVLVFLRTDPATGMLWPLDEAAQFPSSPDLLTVLEDARRPF
jgi:hypothetical protein